MRICVKIGAALVATVLAVPAVAATFTRYDDRAAFNAATGPSTTDDFESEPGAVSAIAGGFLAVTSSGNPAGAFVSNYRGFGGSLGALDATGTEADNFGEVTATSTLVEPFFIPAIGFDVLDLTAAPTEVATVTILFDDATSATFAVTDADSDFDTAPFFGIASTTGIRGFSVYSANIFEGEIGARPNRIDNLTVGFSLRTTPVPAPSAVALFGAGVLLLGCARRR